MEISIFSSFFVDNNSELYKKKVIFSTIQPKCVKRINIVDDIIIKYILASFHIYLTKNNLYSNYLNAEFFGILKLH